MTTSENELTIKRILVALDASSHSNAALRMATELASQLDAELTGIFVEDINLHRLAGMPFAKEVGFLTGDVHLLDSSLIKRQFRTVARQAHQTMEALMKKRKLRWSFRRVQGVIPSELLTAALDADILILGKSGWSNRKQLGSTARVMVVNPPQQAFFIRPGIRLGSPVMVIYDGSQAAKKAIIVSQLIHTGDLPLNVLLLASDENQAKIQHTEVQNLVRKKITVNYLWSDVIDSHSLSHRAISSNCGILILPSESDLISSDTLLSVLNSTDCGVLLIK
jgi:nucleotide-binding universal stress UspA family protein